MLIINQDYSVTFSLFKQFPQLVCFMSTREAGDYSFISTGKVQLYSYRGGEGVIVRMNQVHSSVIKIVKKADNGKYVQADGLVTLNKRIALAVNTADCVPLFMYDPHNSAIGIVHAGWRGTLGTIALNAVRKLQDIGSDPKNIYVAIGPHIGGCCYSVEVQRANAFNDIFYDDRIVFQERDTWYIDLGQANKFQLLEAGVLMNHIDAPITCTSCQNELYFSYRKDSPETFGEMLGVIGFKN